MILTMQQLQTLKVDILADATLAAFAAEGSVGPIVTAYSAIGTPSNPTYTVWKTSVPIASIGDSINGTELGNLTTANTSRLQVIQGFFMQRGVNPSKADLRQMFDDIFSTGGVTKASLLALWKRLATRGEALYATGNGANATPSTLVVEGLVTDVNVQAALAA